MSNPPRVASLLEFSLGQSVGQCRVAALELGPGAPAGLVAAFGADYDVDPYHEMFFYPTDTLKIAALTIDPAGKARELWRRDLGRGVVPGMWFCPVFPFDLDGDGVDEIWFVDNPDAGHPLGVSHYELKRLDARTGEVTGAWPWPNHGGNTCSPALMFRNFLFGGEVRGERVLVTAQGTYENMFLQAFNGGMKPRWQKAIRADEPGARGAHMNPVLDIDGDGSDEVLWGERCLSLDTGEEKFCCDREVYRGHSDIIQPVWDRTARRWFIYTFRESDAEARPRVVLFDDRGRRVWGDVDAGHMDMGWVARLGPRGEQVATALRIGHKKSGAGGHDHGRPEEFSYDALTGALHPLPFATYQTLPVDLDGDGRHELVRGLYRGNGDVLAADGSVTGNVGGGLALAGRIFGDLPGEQVVAISPGGTLRVWADKAAGEPSPEALARYENPFYRRTLKMTASGFHINLLGGL